jgi:D-lactate dehydrogenase
MSTGKILAYTVRDDEVIFFETFSKRCGLDVEIRHESPSLKTVPLARDFPCISIITTPLDAATLAAFYDCGVRFISTRTIGYEHIDVTAARKLGIRIANVSYSPDTVSNYAVMLMLMTIRNIKLISRTSAAQDFSLRMERGREIKNMTVGVAGTGRIGTRVIRHLSGFGCNILAYDTRPNDEASRSARYVSWEEFLAQSDIITLHMPAITETHHLINAQSIAKMKDGVYIINTARGSLIDTPAFLDAVERGKIAGAALDVVEDEAGLYYRDLRGAAVSNRELAVLKSYPNVIVTPHTAFYTAEAVRDMIENSLISCGNFLRGEDIPWEVQFPV